MTPFAIKKDVTISIGKSLIKDGSMFRLYWWAICLHHPSIILFWSPICGPTLLYILFILKFNSAYISVLICYCFALFFWITKFCSLFINPSFILFFSLLTFWSSALVIFWLNSIVFMLFRSPWSPVRFIGPVSVVFLRVRLGCRLVLDCWVDEATDCSLWRAVLSSVLCLLSAFSLCLFYLVGCGSFPSLIRLCLRESMSLSSPLSLLDCVSITSSAPAKIADLLRFMLFLFDGLRTERLVLLIFSNLGMADGISSSLIELFRSFFVMLPMSQKSGGILAPSILLLSRSTKFLCWPSSWVILLGDDSSLESSSFFSFFFLSLSFSFLRCSCCSSSKSLFIILTMFYPMGSVLNMLKKSLNV